MQALSLACLVYAGTRVHQGIVRYEHYRTTKLVAFEPLLVQEHRAVAPHLPAPIQPRLALESKPGTSALVVTPSVRVVAERRPAVPEATAPELKLESKKLVIPNVPTSPVVAVGTFSHESPVTAPVVKLAPVLQAGGFGAVVGNSAVQSRGGSGVVGGTGSFDSAGGSGQGTGPGRGAGAGAGGTTSSVVAASGFGNGAIDNAPVRAKAAQQQPGSEADTPVEITFKPRPDYTDEGRKQKVNGEVRLEVLFKSDGRVQVMKVVKGLGYGLDEQAVKAAQQIKFKPALREGMPIDSMAQIHIIFELIS